MFRFALISGSVAAWILCMLYHFAENQKLQANIKLNPKRPCCSQTKISCSFQWCTCSCCESNIMYRKMDGNIHGNRVCI
jgi:hypothetical protein